MHIGKVCTLVGLNGLCNVPFGFVVYFVIVLSMFVVRLRNIETLSNLLRSVILLSPGVYILFMSVIFSPFIDEIDFEDN